MDEHDLAPKGDVVTPPGSSGAAGVRLKDRLFGSVALWLRALIGTVIVALCVAWALHLVGPDDGPTQQTTSTFARVNQVATPPARHARTFGAGSGEPQRPSSVGLPSVLGDPRVGKALVCSRGTWSGAPTFRVRWSRDGVVVPGEDAEKYTVQAVDEGTILQCQVTATNTVGATTAISQGLAVQTRSTTEAHVSTGGDGTTTQPPGVSQAKPSQVMSNPDGYAISTHKTRRKIDEIK
jgi:hypothetical protein